MPEQPSILEYRRAQFTARLPVDYRYTPSHAWLAREENGVWRVGFTRFATRMLGELVDHGFGVEPGAPVTLGQVVGWVEGFKAISDLFCAAEGKFAGGNPALKERVTLVTTDCCGAGWLYRVQGNPDPGTLDVHGYRDLLDATIDRMLKEKE